MQCPFPNCEYETNEVDGVAAAALLNIHALIHTAPVNQVSSRQQPPKIDRPTISRGTTQKEWSIFKRKWMLFKNGTSIPPEQLTTQLWQCCDEELEADLFRDIPDISTTSETDLLQTIKTLAVVSVGVIIRRVDLLALRQDHGQTIRSFVAKVKGKAQTCGFSKRCSSDHCQQVVDYTEDIIKSVLISGIADEGIKRDIFSATDLDSCPLNNIISLIENKEMAASNIAGSGLLNVVANSSGVCSQSNEIQAGNIHSGTKKRRKRKRKRKNAGGGAANVDGGTGNADDGKASHQFGELK